jgi:hypothetical protein
MAAPKSLFELAQQLSDAKAIGRFELVGVLRGSSRREGLHRQCGNRDVGWKKLYAWRLRVQYLSKPVRARLSVNGGREDESKRGKNKVEKGLRWIEKYRLREVQPGVKVW